MDSEEEYPDFQMEAESSTIQQEDDEIEDQTTQVYSPGAENYDIEYDSSTFAYNDDEYFNGESSTATEIIPTTTIIYDQVDEG